jgi:cholesterol transport system auxiliary component
MRTTAYMNISERWCRLWAASLCLMLASGCTALRMATTNAAPPSFYSLGNARGAADATPRSLPTAAPTLVVSASRAAAGFDSQRIIYVRQPHKLEYFAHSEWIDTPARMLSPLVVAAVENSGTFRAVVQAPSSASGELRLDTEVLQLQHEFEGQPSRVRFVLRANLVEDATRRVIASREFEAVATAPSEDPYGGVIAANQAVRTVLEELAAFCAEAAGSWRPASRGEDARPHSKPL